jgi:uncharacterized protein (DUF697 family)
MLAKLGLGPQDFFFVSAKRGTNVPELVKRIADILPDAMQDAFIAQQQADVQLKEKRVRTLVYSKASISAAIALLPIPVADIFLITPMQIAMVSAIGYFYGVDVNKERVLELFATLGAGFGFRQAARQLVKLVPGYGTVISAAIAFAGTVALGETAHVWFKNKMKFDADELREVFQRSAARAQDEYRSRVVLPERIKSTVEDLHGRLERGELSSEEFELAVARLVDSDG